jgi:membrane protein insertase Oxa1/YidC/SpoIIIJ
MFLQQKLTPSTATGAQAKQQKNMMYFMMIFFGLILYNAPSGLNLYIMASTAAGVVESYIIRKKIKKEEAEGGGKSTKGKKEKSRWHLPQIFKK